MPLLASEVLEAARKVYLNDSSATLYSDTVLLPMLSKAYDELQQHLELNSNQSLIEISTAITVLANTNTVTLPSNFVSPIRLTEKKLGSSDPYILMTQVDSIPFQENSRTLNFWTYREDSIYVAPAIEDIEVLLYYYKSLDPIVGTNTNIPILNSKTFLTARTAALAAKYIGMNTILGNAIDGEAALALSELVRSRVKNKQYGARQRPFGWRVRNGTSGNGY